MKVALVRTRLAAAVAAVKLADNQIINTYGYVPDAPTVPCFYAGEAEYDPLTNFGGTDSVEITCRVLTSISDDKAGQAALDALLCRTGTSSIRAALEAARGAPGQHALSGACDDFAITRIRGYRLYRVGADAYFGAEIIIHVVGDGTED